MKKIMSTLSAVAIVVSVCAPMANAEYDAKNGYYTVDSGFMVTATQLYKDGVIEKGTKKAQYDEGSSKKGVITLTAEDERSESAVDILVPRLRMKVLWIMLEKQEHRLTLR